MKIPKNFRQVKLPDGTTRIFIDEDEFPWATQRGTLKVEKDKVSDRAHWVTLTILVDGPVELS